jgi:hypothetical protein
MGSLEHTVDIQAMIQCQLEPELPDASRDAKIFADPN